MSGPISSYFKKYQDPRTADWFLVGQLEQMALILVAYVYFCTKLGPRLMKNRKPFELRRVIQLYNLFQILISCYIVYEGLVSGWGTHYSFWCQPVGKSTSPEALRMASAVWVYYMNKYIELLDTVFFVLRKKYNQITFLHIYHHTLMPFCAFLGVTFFPGGHGTFLGLINSFIHIIMYTYYLVASFGPEYQKYLWWKKHLTTLQLIQFCMIFFHNFQVLFRECDYYKVLNVLLAIESGYFIYLFGKFYVNAYIKKRPQDTVVETEKSIQNGEKTRNGVLRESENHQSHNEGNGVNGKIKAH